MQEVAFTLTSVQTVVIPQLFVGVLWFVLDYLFIYLFACLVWFWICLYFVCVLVCLFCKLSQVTTILSPLSL